MSLGVILIKYTVACVTGLYIATLIAISFIFKRSAFDVKKRDKPPKCLTDSSLWKHGHLHLKGIKIHYVEKGDPRKPLMLFLHGFPEFWYSWRYQLKEFSKDYWTVAIDMRGYGDSEKPPGIENYAMDHLVNDVKEAVEALGRHKFTLVAHDWGGLVAWYFVYKHHDMLDTYIILNAPYTPTFLQIVLSNRKQFFKSWYVFFYMVPYLPELLFPFNDFGVLAKVFRRNKPKDISPMTDEDIEAFKYTFSKPGALTPPINYYRHIMRTLGSAKSSETKIDIDVPGLLMFGDLDDFLILDNLTIAQKYVKNLQVRIVKGANHFVQQDDPDTVNKYMREFLKKTSQ